MTRRASKRSKIHQPCPEGPQRFFSQPLSSAVRVVSPSCMGETPVSRPLTINHSAKRSTRGCSQKARSSSSSGALAAITNAVRSLWLANCYGRADLTGNRAAQVNWLSLSERIRRQ